MDAKEMQVTQRLLKKLSALRATLSNEERNILDSMVVSTPEDVEAHVLKEARIEAKMPDADEVVAHSNKEAKIEAKMPAADEVVAHSNKEAKIEAKMPAADEVVAHSSKEARIEASVPKPIEKSQPVIVFNQDKDEYRIL